MRHLHFTRSLVEPAGTCAHSQDRGTWIPTEMLPVCYQFLASSPAPCARWSSARTCPCPLLHAGSAGQHTLQCHSNRRCPGPAQQQAGTRRAFTEIKMVFSKSFVWICSSEKLLCKDVWDEPWLERKHSFRMRQLGVGQAGRAGGAHPEKRRLQGELQAPCRA